VPYTLAASSRSQASPGAVYTLLAHTGTWPSWSPIDEAHVEGGADPAGPQQPGDVRVVRIGRVISRERITGMIPDRQFSYEIIGGPFRFYRGVVELAATTDSGTDIAWSATFEPKLVLSGQFFRWYLSRFTQRLADGLARYAGTHQHAR
jgi:hypothetical protein